MHCSLHQSLVLTKIYYDLWYAQIAKSPNDHQGAHIPCKSKRVFNYQAGAGAPTQYWLSGYREEPRVLGYIAYIGSREKFEKWEFLGWETANWSPSVEGLGVGFWLILIFPGWPWVLIGSHYLGRLCKVRRFWSGVWLARGWWGEVRGFTKALGVSKALFLDPYKMEFFC